MKYFNYKNLKGYVLDFKKIKKSLLNKFLGILKNVFRIF